jgi:hypothetical protein
MVEVAGDTITVPASFWNGDAMNSAATANTTSPGSRSHCRHQTAKNQ